MQLDPRVGRVQLEVENRGLDSLLLVAGEPGEAVDEGVGNAKFHLFHPKYLHYLVAQVVDHLNRNAAGLGFVKRARGVAVERVPGVFVDFGFEGRSEGLVRIAGAQEK